MQIIQQDIISTGNYLTLDFRVYATALSDADILELYNSPISIDNTGKVHALEFREV